MDGEEPGEDRAATRARHDPPRGVVYLLPTSPGPLRKVDGQVVGDELDRRIWSSLNGTVAAAGWPDAVLLAAGGVLLAWTVLGGGSGGWGVLGAALLLLGAAIPIRRLAWGMSERRQDRRVQQLLADGSALDTTDPSVGQLATAYGGLVLAATRPRVIVPDGTLEDAHGRVVDVARRLRGRAPADAATTSHVNAQIRAIEELTAGVVPAPATPTQRRRSRPKRALAGVPIDPAVTEMDPGHAGT